MTLPAELRATPAALQHLMIPALDGRADVWVNLGDAELAPSVQLDIDDEAIAGPGERTTMGLSLSPAQARELIHALTVAAEAAEGRRDMCAVGAQPSGASAGRPIARIRAPHRWEGRVAIGALLLVAAIAGAIAYSLFRN